MILLSYLISIVDTIIYVFEIILFVYCILTWFIKDPFNKLLVTLKSIVDPVLRPVTDFLYRFSFFRSLPIDLAPIIVFFLCRIVRSII